MIELSGPGSAEVLHCLPQLNMSDFSHLKPYIYTVIPNSRIGIKGIAEILFRFWGEINQMLKRLFGTLPNYLEPEKTACFSVYNRQDVDPVFLFPMKENTSSISASVTFSG